jgi:hypothetical protein
MTIETCCELIKLVPEFICQENGISMILDFGAYSNVSQGLPTTDPYAAEFVEVLN